MSQLEKGARLGDRFEILDSIARGGYAEVYGAIDLVRLELVAIKILLPHVSIRPDCTQKFEDEIEIAIDLAAAAPDCFPRIIATVRKDGDAALVMEYLNTGGNPGVSALSSLLTEKTPLEPLHAVDIGLKILKGLHAAYLAGVVLRDIKPANVLLGKDGAVKLCDFGIASAKRPERFGDHHVVGSLPYMAPELFCEEYDGLTSPIPDCRSDLYSFGILLYEMLEGHWPYHEAGTASFTQAEDLHTTGQPRPLPDLIPRKLKDIVFALLANNPRRRYQTPWQVGRDLAGFAVSQNPELELAEPYYSFLGRAGDSYGKKKYPYEPLLAFNTAQPVISLAPTTEELPAVAASPPKMTLRQLLRSLFRLFSLSNIARMLFK